jgi:hypothetical protein
MVREGLINVYGREMEIRKPDELKKIAVGECSYLPEMSRSNCSFTPRERCDRSLVLPMIGLRHG